jgi:adenylosuccinate lyase
VVLPDATILFDYMQHLVERVAREMTVRPERMRDNLELTYGALYSQRALTALVESGMQRDDAYRIVQELAQRAWDERTSFRDLLVERLSTSKAGSSGDPAAPGGGAEEAAGIDWDTVFDPSAYLAHVPELFERLQTLKEEGK